MFKLFYDNIPIYLNIEKSVEFSLLEIKFNFLKGNNYVEQWKSLGI